MSLVSRISLAFLAALALILAGFSISVHSLITVRLHQAIDQELSTKLDRFEVGPGHDDGRVGWAFLNDRGAPLEGSEPFVSETAFFPKGPGELTRRTPFTAIGREGGLWRVLLREIGSGGGGGGHRRDFPEPHRGGGGRGERKGHVEPGGGEPRGRRGPPGRWIAVGLRLEPVEAELGALAIQLATLSVGLWGVSAVLGRHFGRRALVPLTRMATAARAMTGFDEGGGRLPSPGTRDELEDFATSFNDLLDRLNESLQRQKQFTGQASHQLRTPLAGVITAIEVARRRPRSVVEHEQILDRVHADALRLGRVVEALLFLARADGEAAIPGLEIIDLATWLPDYLGRWDEHPRFGDIRWEAAANPLRIQAHAELLGQMCDNLLENAFKYSPTGSPVLVRAWSDDDRVALAVEDRGAGIAAADLPHIFEPFYRSEGARRGVAGVGLGLAVVRRIAESLGGRVSAESEPGRGARFVLEWPIAPA